MSRSSKSFFDEVIARDFLNDESPRSFTSSRGGELALSRDGNKKSSLFYNTHSYPTKVPVEDICQFIEKHTDRGGTILDPFCGSGMTALATKLTGRNGYFSDLGTLAMHLTFNHTRTCSPKDLLSTSDRILSSVRSDDNPYRFTVGRSNFELKTLILSSVFACVGCGDDVAFWHAAINPKTFDINKKKKCPSCGADVGRAEHKTLHYSPVHFTYSDVGSKSYQQAPATRGLIRATDFALPKGWRLSVDDVRIAENREMYIRSALKLHGVNELSDFYTDRNLFALDRLYRSISKVGDFRVRSALMLAFTNTCWHGSKMRRFNNRGGHRPLTGTLYIPQLSSEGNVFDIFERKVRTLERFFTETAKAPASTRQVLARTSATHLGHVPDNSIDYVFTDPPFGSNIFYADCNFLAEAWLGNLTDTTQEAVVNKSLKPSGGGKSVFDYKSLLRASFKEISRVLKSGSTGHIVFNNTDGEVWAAVLEAMEEGGLRLTKTHCLDKVQKSVKGNRAENGRENVATIDLVLEFENNKRSARPVVTRRALTPKKLPELVSKLYAKFTQDASSSKDSFVEANFYSFFMAHCHTKGIDTSSVDYGDVKDVLHGVMAQSPRRSGTLRTAV